MKPKDIFTRSSVNLQQLKMQQTPKEKSSTSKLRVRHLSHGVHLIRFAFTLQCSQQTEDPNMQIPVPDTDWFVSDVQGN